MNVSARASTSRRSSSMWFCVVMLFIAALSFLLGSQVRQSLPLVRLDVAKIQSDPDAKSVIGSLDSLMNTIQTHSEKISAIEARQEELELKMMDPAVVLHQSRPSKGGALSVPVSDNKRIWAKSQHPLHVMRGPSIALPGVLQNDVAKHRVRQWDKKPVLQESIRDVSALWAKGDLQADLPTSQALGTKHAKAESQQDTKLYDLYFRRRPGLVNRGVYIEFGARNGIESSNSYFFEKELGWKGVLLEADIREYPALKRIRPGALSIFGAVGAMDGSKANFMISKLIGWSGFAEGYNNFRKQRGGACPCVNVSVPVHHLNRVLERIGIVHVNLMSIDTEGSELAVLRSIDFEAVYFEYVQVEVVLLRQTMASDVGNRIAIEQYMDSNGFKRAQVFNVSSNTLDLVFENQNPVPYGLEQEANPSLNWDILEAAKAYRSSSADWVRRVRSEMDALVRIHSEP